MDNCLQKWTAQFLDQVDLTQSTMLTNEGRNFVSLRYALSK